MIYQCNATSGVLTFRDDGACKRAQPATWDRSLRFCNWHIASDGTMQLMKFAIIGCSWDGSGWDSVWELSAFSCVGCPDQGLPDSWDRWVSVNLAWIIWHDNVIGAWAASKHFNKLRLIALITHGIAKAPFSRYCLSLYMYKAIVHFVSARLCADWLYWLQKLSCKRSRETFALYWRQNWLSRSVEVFLLGIASVQN